MSKQSLATTKTCSSIVARRLGGREDELWRKLDTSAPTHPQRGGKPAGWPGPSVWLHYSLLQLELWASPTSPRSSAKRWRHKQGSVLRRIALVKRYCSISLTAKIPSFMMHLGKSRPRTPALPESLERGKRKRYKHCKEGYQQIKLELCRWS